tara:strand:+ start:1710 stop:2456 length:747 start_codon:yes stop_codon:yes gene_type:complete
MGSLSGNKIKNTYSSILKLETNGATSSLKTIEDGAGVDTALKISTTEVQVDALSFATVPTTNSSELTALLVDSSNNVVKRELNAVAFAGVTTQFFANPMFVLRPNTAYTLVNTPATPTQGGVNNNSTTSSYLFNDSSNTHLQTSSTTTGAISVVRAGAIKIEVNFILEITTQNTDVTIRVYRKPAGGSAAVIETVVRTNVATGTMAIGFSLFTYCAANAEDIYYQIGKNSGGGGALNTNSTFTVTKLD